MEVEGEHTRWTRGAVIDTTSLFTLSINERERGWSAAITVTVL